MRNPIQDTPLAVIDRFTDRSVHWWRKEKWQKRIATYKIGWLVFVPADEIRRLVREGKITWKDS